MTGFCCMPLRRDAGLSARRPANRGPARQSTIERGARRMEAVARRFLAKDAQPPAPGQWSAALLLIPAVKLIAAADYVAGSGLPGETTREISAIPRTARVQSVIDDLNKLVLSSKDAAPFMKSPHARCYQAACAIQIVLYNAGYATAYRVMGIWDGSGVDMRNHVVVLAKMDGVAFFVDITAHQFPELGFDGALIDIEPNAMARFLAQGSVLIKYRDFPTYGPAQAFADFGLLSVAQSPLDGAMVARPFPAWYEPDSIRSP